MASFNFLTLDFFAAQLKTYEEIARLDVQNQPANILVDSIFLYMYSQLEHFLYQECQTQLVKKKANLSRFEEPLNQLGFSLDNKPWQTLLHSSKIRNCLLHGNGRIDDDQYGKDTLATINILNEQAKSELIGLKKKTNNTTLAINKEFLFYFMGQIKDFIALQN